MLSCVPKAGAALEKIIAMKPNVYIISGSERSNKSVLPFGYNIYHHFYNPPYNIIATKIRAKDFYPAQFADMNPTADVHQIITRFTQLPDDPIMPSYSQSKK